MWETKTSTIVKQMLRLALLSILLYSYKAPE